VTSSHEAETHEAETHEAESDEGQSDERTPPHAEGLFVALVLAPGTFPRNKFFELYRDEELMLARRRAQFVRNLLKDLTEPWTHPQGGNTHSAPVIEEEIEKDGLFYLSYRFDELRFRRRAVLSLLEAKTLLYALHQSGRGHISAEDRNLVESHLAKLSPLYSRLQ
jgi:hypothetical protein